MSTMELSSVNYICKKCGAALKVATSYADS